MAPGDAFAELSTLLESLQDSGREMAPAFVFVDPYGFKVPAQLLTRLMAAGRVELFVNVIWRELDMAISGGRGRFSRKGIRVGSALRRTPDCDSNRAHLNKTQDLPHLMGLPAPRPARR